MMISDKLIALSAILFALSSSLLASPNSWSAYSDGSSFRDVFGGRSYEEAFGDPYDSLFGSSLTGGSYGGGGTSSPAYGTQERSPIKVIPQQRSDSDFGYQSGGPKYASPAVTVRSGHRSSYGSSPQSSYGSKGISQTKSSHTTKGGYSGAKPSYGTTSTKTTQQSVDSEYDSNGGLSDIPDTGFQCLNRNYGYYADVSAGCQIFHVCQPDGRKWSFWCPEGTAYHQKVQTCDWAYNVDCPSSPDFYFLNERIGVLPAQDATLQRF